MRFQLCAVLTLTVVVSLGQPVRAEPPAGAPAPTLTLRKRMATKVRDLSLRAANGYRNLSERVPPALRHGGMALLSSGATYASMQGLASHGDITSPMGLLSLTGVVLGMAGTLHQGTRTLKAGLPGPMGRLKERLRRAPLLKPWLTDSRPWLQRLRSRFRRGASNTP